MSCIRINITDREQTVSGEVHGSEGDALIAALSAEPEIIAELEHALSRFIKPHGDFKPFARFSRHENYEQYDAGILVINLAARVIACESTYNSPSKKGEVRYHDGNSATDVSVRYRLPDDWVIVRSMLEYKSAVARRLAERAKNEPLDVRKILYGRELIEFIVSQTAAAQKRNDENSIADIHERWLMTAREDLSGKTPREVVFEKKDLIDDDLFSREMQWSFGGECPPFLPTDSHAYRFAGVGAHEWVIYYDLVRFLLDEADNENQSIEALEQLKDDWLNLPGNEFHGRSPALVIERERRRIPPAMSAEDALISHDCPVCRMMSEDFETPMFWHLDGSNMDDRFAFSIYNTLEEWEEEQRSWQEYNEDFNRQRDAAFFDENTIIEEPDEAV